MILLKNCFVYDPRPAGIKDILTGGGKILEIDTHINLPPSPWLEIYDLQEQRVIPGLVDSHMHIAGAGGEGGPATRTPPVQAAEIIRAGITSVVGCLGTDGITRSVQSVLMQAKALCQQGLSAWMYTGSYQIPPPTLTGRISRDISWISEIIGVGEIALADHRSSYPSVSELVAIVQETRLGSMLAGKKGVVNIHLGDSGVPFAKIHEAASIPGIGYNHFLPTHCNRSQSVFAEAAEYARHSIADLTASSYPYFSDIEIKPSRGFVKLRESGVPLDHISVSSDAGGSLPRFDHEGNSQGISFGSAASLLRESLDILHENSDFSSEAFFPVTRTPARFLGLKGKGEIRQGFDADLLVLNHELTEIKKIMALGNWLTP